MRKHDNRPYNLPLSEIAISIFALIILITMPLPAMSQLRPGTIYWGADGHRDKGGVYTSVPLSQQITDLKRIYGNTPNTIFYRAWDSIIGYESDVTQLQSAGIIPLVPVITYPDWSSFSDETAAYNWAYSTVTTAVQAVPTNIYWVVGNEWNTQAPIGSQYLNDGSVASDWTSAPSYPLYRGAAAGAIAAIRDNNSAAQIIGGAITGWLPIGFADALANDLANYHGRNLMWDYTNLHWYNDIAPASDSAGDMGMPDNFYGGMDAYTLLYPAGKPLFIDEIGSSNGNVTGNNTAAGIGITNLMENLLAHSNATSTERGVVGGAAYELYPITGQTDYFLYNYSGGSTTTIAPQGTVVKNWIASHNNPSINSGPKFSLSGTAITIAEPGLDGTSTITVTPSHGFSGNVTLTCNVYSAPYAGNAGTPNCTVSSPARIADNRAVTATLTVPTISTTPPGNYVITLTATGYGSATDTSVSLAVN